MEVVRGLIGQRLQGLDVKQVEVNINGCPGPLIHHQREAAAERIRNAPGFKRLEERLEFDVQINPRGQIRDPQSEIGMWPRMSRPIPLTARSGRR